MGFLNSWRASFLSGKAFMKFNKKEYIEAISLIEKICKLDPKMDRIEICYSYLGRSYVKIGKFDDALKVMNNAYDLFLIKINKIDEKQYHQEFKVFLDAFIYLLNEMGQIDRANEVARQKDHL
jgi:tetratricopeptide (TPR) repeat protein